jgi:hypothetical protein
MSLAYPHWFLPCPNMHLIPVPYSGPSEIDGSPRRRTNSPVNVVCPECGVVSAYSIHEATGGLYVDKPNLFQEGECHLVAIEVECDGENCEALKVVHAILGDDKGTWRPLAARTSWHFSDAALCGAGHKLRFEEPIHWTNLRELPW